MSYLLISRRSGMARLHRN